MPLDPLLAQREATIDAIAGITPAEADELRAAPYGPLPSTPVTVEDAVVPGVLKPARVYRPADRASDPRPGLVWCHGGGFAWGDLEMPEADLVSRAMAAQLGSTVISVDYRLVGGGDDTPPDGQPTAPVSNAYPAAHDDVMAVWQWAIEHSRDLGVDPARWAIGGASAGANIISGVVLHLRDASLPLPCVWLPIYPVVHRDLPAPSGELAASLAEHQSGFTVEAVRSMNARYVDGSADTAYAFPGDRTDLGGLPPALVVNAQYDELRSSGERFIEQLEEAGTSVTHFCEQGMTHGHLNLPGHPAAWHTVFLMADAITGAAPTESGR